MVKQTLYSGGLIYDGLHQVLEDQAVLVENEHIKEVGPVGDFHGFVGDRVDFSGGTLLPGLIDCHVHLIYGGEGDPKSKVGGSK
ncbi:MAG: amidohydrolase family protein, partial [SAR324 cluster bacterium]|nr:amidohydrolase family protein [SAR324 cluster bacterium]